MDAEMSKEERPDDVQDKEKENGIDEDHESEVGATTESEYEPSDGSRESTPECSTSSGKKNFDREYSPADSISSEDSNDSYRPGDFSDDNESNSFRQRLALLGKPTGSEDFTITRNVTSEEFGESSHPWKVDTATWKKLHPFQQEGVEWLQKKTDHRSGGILADQMGLGKTIQAVVFLRSISETNRTFYKTTGLDNCLIVCPSSVLTQWIKALNEWFPKVRVFLLHGQCSTGKSQNYVKTVLKKIKTRSECPDGAVVLTTYKMFTNLSADLVEPFWQVAILDEGHLIRNEKTKCSMAMRNLKSTQRFILTGTPFQNKLAEFWKLVDFVHPGRLSDATTFNKNFISIIKAGSDLRCSPEAAAKAYECLVALHRAVKPLILRRLQEDHKDVLQLPEKDDKVLSCELSSRQRRYYERYLNSGQVADILAGRLMAFCGIQRLSEICNHPGIFKGAEIGSEKFGSIKDSGKVEMTFKLLKQWLRDPTNRVIFFTQRKLVIEMMKHFLSQKGIKHVSLTGSDSVAARPKIIQKFEDDPTIKVFLMTTRAGGLGLNLTHANKVIIFDPDWNPAADNQAKDRCYRMGQTSNVSIVRLISNGTVEDRIYMKQIQKEMLAAQLLHNTDVDHVVPNNTVADLFRLKPKGLEGSEIGLYLPGEITKADGTSSSKKSTKDGKKKKDKKLKHKLAGFEDKSLLISLFDKEKLVAMRQHSITVQNNATMNRKEKQAMREAVDRAVGSLVHTEGRLAQTWKENFHKMIKGHRDSTMDYHVEKQELDSYWATVHHGFRANDDQMELDRLLRIAKDMVVFLNGVSGAEEEKLSRIFLNEKDKTNPTQLFFFQEILSTLARFDEGKSVWKLKKKYRNVEFVEQRKRRSDEIEPMSTAKKAKM